MTGRGTKGRFLGWGQAGTSGVGRSKESLTVSPGCWSFVTEIAGVELFQIMLRKGWREQL